MEVWLKINDYLNYYGGLISTISFLVSIFIFVKTGQIKKSIKNLLSHEKYSVQKVKAKTRLEGILDSIQKDDIFDKELMGEIQREISALEHYAVFFDKKMGKNMKNIQKVLEKPYSNNKRDEVVIAINKILGDLDITEIYVG